jgi:hypothetical protein
MNLTSTSWACQQCAAACIGDPPWHRLCNQCLACLQALARQALPGTARCPSCGGPACPDCGDALPFLVPVPAPAGDPAGDPAAGQLTGLLPGSLSRRQQGVTGNDR